MGIFTRPKAEHPGGPLSPAAKRAALLPSHELVPWAETCLYQVGRSLTDYQRDSDPVALAEATQAVAVLDAIVQEINARAGEAVYGGPPG